MHLALAIFARSHADGAPALFGQMRQSLKCGPCTAITIDEGAKGARPNIFTADQTQPIETLRIRQLHGESPVKKIKKCFLKNQDLGSAFWPILPSVPFNKR